MLPTQCSFCQHENAPGARFCAECGSPMHLKVCPNPACGKVSDVGAAVCETCGQAFPPLTSAAAASKDSAAPIPAAEPANETPAAVKPPTRTAAWPLIMMAVVAGGIPLLWANRAQLPTPKTWQLNTPDAPTAGAAAPTPPPAAPAADVPAPAPAQVAPAPPPEPVSAAVASAAQQTDATKVAPGGETPPKKSKPRRKAVKKEAQPTCTEAAAALNLCNPR